MRPQSSQFEPVVQILDDKPRVREALCRAFKMLGWRPFAYAEPESAIDSLGSIWPQVAFVDLSMTDDASNRDGIELVNALLKRRGVFTVVMSSYIEDDDFRNILPSMGHSGTVYRKESMSRLRDVRQLLEHGHDVAKRDRNGMKKHHIAQQLVHAVGGPNGAGEFRMHIGADEGTISILLAAELWNEYPLVPKGPYEKPALGNGFVSNVLWSVGLGCPVWVGCSSNDCPSAVMEQAFRSTAGKTDYQLQRRDMFGFSVMVGLLEEAQFPRSSFGGFDWNSNSFIW